MADERLENAIATDLSKLRKILENQKDADKLCPIEMKDIYIEHESLNKIPTIVSSLTDNKKVLIVCDGTPIYRKNVNVKHEIYDILKEEFNTELVILLENSSDIHCTLENSKKIQAKMEGVGCVIAVGSGTVTDLCKHATYYYEEGKEPIPLVVFQTALSVNAFSDGVSVMLLNGVKRTIHSRYPSVLIIDLDVIENAPAEMNVSGYGDLIATWTAPADWYLSNTCGMNPNFHDVPADLIRKQCRELLEQSKKLAEVDSQTIEHLANVLTLSGLSMGIAGESSPCSGSEHIISHLIDMASKVRKTGICYHGTQVAVSGILASIIWDIFLAEFDPKTVDIDKCYPAKEEMEGIVKNAFSWLDDTNTAAEECWSDYRIKLANWYKQKEAFKRFLDEFDTFRNTVKSQVLKPEYICDCMHKANAPTRYSKLNYYVDAETARWALKNCCLMRNRFSVIDLLYFTGKWNDELIERILERAESLDAGL